MPIPGDPPIPIGATVTIYYDHREIDGELLGGAIDRAAGYVRIPIGESRHRIIVRPWSAIQRKHTPDLASRRDANPADRADSSIPSRAAATPTRQRAQPTPSAGLSVRTPPG
jgi:hypothetical protein